MWYMPTGYQISFIIVIGLLSTMASKNIGLGIAIFLIAYGVAWISNYMLRPSIKPRKVVSRRVVRRKTVRQ